MKDSLGLYRCSVETGEKLADMSALGLMLRHDLTPKNSLIKLTGKDQKNPKNFSNLCQVPGLI